MHSTSNPSSMSSSSSTTNNNPSISNTVLYNHTTHTQIYSMQPSILMNMSHQQIVKILFEEDKRHPPTDNSYPAFFLINNYLVLGLMIHMQMNVNQIKNLIRQVTGVPIHQQNITEEIITKEIITLNDSYSFPSSRGWRVGNKYDYTVTMVNGDNTPASLLSFKDVNNIYNMAKIKEVASPSIVKSNNSSHFIIVAPYTRTWVIESVAFAQNTLAFYLPFELNNIIAEYCQSAFFSPLFLPQRAGTIRQINTSSLPGTYNAFVNLENVIFDLRTEINTILDGFFFSPDSLSPFAPRGSIKRKTTVEIRSYIEGWENLLSGEIYNLFNQEIANQWLPFNSTLKALILHLEDVISGLKKLIISSEAVRQAKGWKFTEDDQTIMQMCHNGIEVVLKNTKQNRISLEDKGNDKARAQYTLMVAPTLFYKSPGEPHTLQGLPLKKDDPVSADATKSKSCVIL